MNRLNTLLWTVGLSTVCIVSQAQITYGGSPWHEGPRPGAIEFPAMDLEALRAEDDVTDRYKEAPWRFGVEHDVALNAVEHGAWTVENGHRVWRLAVHAEGAVNMSVRFDQFDVPEGGVVFIYAADASSVIGALDHRNMKDWGGLATGVLATSELVVEYRQPLGLQDMPSLSIDQIVQGYRPLSGWPHHGDRGPFGSSGSCNINVNCPQGDEWQVEKRSVALIVSGGYGACTGALVNNTANDGTPYFLTADHCLGNPGSWVYYFNHESATCNGTTAPTNQSISGGTLLVAENGADVALIELSQTPPSSFNVQYAGWDATGVVPDGTVGIHHPGGDIKKICFDYDSPFPQNMFGGTAVWYINEWEDGVTEPGSSGSPLFDLNHRIIGQLYGGTAACTGFDQNGPENNGEPDWYGRFNVSWNLGLSDYLDPTNTGTLVLNGYPVGAFANDASVSITGSPESVVCGAQDVAIEVTISNAGESTLTTCLLEYSINGGPTLQQSWGGSLEQFESETVTLNAFTTEDGVNTVEVTLVTPNGVEDENNANNTAEVEFSSFTGTTVGYSLNMVLDNWGSETTWTLKRFGQTVYSGGPYSDFTSGQVITESFCLEEGCYQFRVNDSAGNGMCCSSGNGSWSILDAQGNVVDTGGEFLSVQQVQICAEATSGTEANPHRDLMAFPVPANHVLNVVWPESNGHARILDMVGRTVDEAQVQSPESQWDTSDWASGQYLISWNGASGTRQVKQISVTH